MSIAIALVHGRGGRNEEDGAECRGRDARNVGRNAQSTTRGLHALAEGVAWAFSERALPAIPASLPLTKRSQWNFELLVGWDPESLCGGGHVCVSSWPRRPTEG